MKKFLVIFMLFSAFIADAQIKFNVNTTIEQDEFISSESNDEITLDFNFTNFVLEVTSENKVLWSENILGYEHTIPEVKTIIWTNMSKWEIIYGPYPKPIIAIEFPYIGVVENRKYYFKNATNSN